jgi:hypothetical protein
MKLGETFDFKDVTLNDWAIFCEQVNFSFPVLKQILRDKCIEITAALNEERKQLIGTEFDDEMLDKIANQIQNNCARTHQLLSVELVKAEKGRKGKRKRRTF